MRVLEEGSEAYVDEMRLENEENLHQTRYTIYEADAD